jgi:hypothetical protein
MNITAWSLATLTFGWRWNPGSTFARLDPDVQAGDGVEQLILLDLEMGEEGASQAIDGPIGVLQAGLVLDHGHQGRVDLGDQAGDGLVLAGEAVEDGADGWVAPAQVAEQVGVLDGVMRRDHPAVGGAERAEGPVVLPHGHLVQVRPGPVRPGPAGGDLAHDLAELVELLPQVLVHRHERLRPDRAGDVRRGR